MSRTIGLFALAVILSITGYVSAAEEKQAQVTATAVMDKADESMGKAGMAAEDMMAEGDMAMDDMMEPQDVGNKICPIEGNPIKEEEAFKIEHNGKIYNLCSAPCVQKFVEDPDKYIATLPKEEMKKEDMKKEDMPKEPVVEKMEMPAATK